jgi:hypothetical protein
MDRGCDDFLNESDKTRCIQYNVIKSRGGRGRELGGRKEDV